MQKIPYMLVVGDKEVSERAVNVRRYGEKESRTMGLDEFMALLVDDVREKRTRLGKAQ